MKDYTTFYIGMDVHKTSFSLACYHLETDSLSHYQKTAAEAKEVISYLNSLADCYGENTKFVCGYEAGCLGFTLKRQLEAKGITCIVMAPTTILQPSTKKRVKTDKKDAEHLAKCLAFKSYQPVHVPTEEDEQVKEFIRMRDDHNLALKKIKQQILAFCLRHDYRFTLGKSHWTQKHIAWLKGLELKGLYKEILSEYLITFDYLVNKLERLDKRIEEIAQSENYQDKVKKLSCFIGVRTRTALALVSEIGDFKRFKTAPQFASYLGLVPGEDSSGDKQTYLGITKAGNSHVRRLLVESVQSLSRGTVGYKSKALKTRQAGNLPEIIAYADKGNERLRRRYKHMVLSREKKSPVSKIALARELACFIWGMMTENIA
ncbi:IS110 family transposase [Streptococcus pneumoniae]